MFALKAGGGKLSVEARNSQDSYATYQLSDFKLYCNFSIICNEPPASDFSCPSLEGLGKILIQPVKN